MRDESNLRASVARNRRRLVRQKPGTGPLLSRAEMPAPDAPDAIDEAALLAEIKLIRRWGTWHKLRRKRR